MQNRIKKLNQTYQFYPLCSFAISPVVCHGGSAKKFEMRKNIKLKF